MVATATAPPPKVGVTVSEFRAAFRCVEYLVSTLLHEKRAAFAALIDGL